MQDEIDRIDYLLRSLKDDGWWELYLDAELYRAFEDLDESESFDADFCIYPIH
jgi:hypothetical protein